MERGHRYRSGRTNRGRRQGQVPGWAEPEEGACAVLPLGFWEGVWHSSGAAPGERRRLTHPRTLSRPRTPPLTRPILPEHSGAAAPGTARLCGSRRPPEPRPGLQRPLPALPGPLRSPPDPGPSPGPVPLPPPARREPHAAGPAPRGL